MRLLTLILILVILPPLALAHPGLHTHPHKQGASSPASVLAHPELHSHPHEQDASSPSSALAHSGLHSHSHEQDALSPLLALDHLVMLLGIVLAVGLYYYRYRARRLRSLIRRGTALGETDCPNAPSLLLHHTRVGDPYG
jgi:hydrogenase/urease accessory protein HupE